MSDLVVYYNNISEKNNHMVYHQSIDYRLKHDDAVDINNNPTTGCNGRLTFTNDEEIVVPPSLQHIFENDSRLSDSRNPLTHTHTIANITDLQTILDSKYSVSNPPPSSSSINTLKKTSIQIINGTAFQDISNLTFPVVNGVNYAFKYYIVFRSAATTTGFRFGVNCPTGTLDYFHTYQTIANSNALGVATWLQRHDVTRDAMTATTATITAGVDLVCIIEGRYLCTQNGTFAPRVASELANNDLVIQIGSWGTWF